MLDLSLSSVDFLKKMNTGRVRELPCCVVSLCPSNMDPGRCTLYVQHEGSLLAANGGREENVCVVVWGGLTFRGSVSASFNYISTDNENMAARSSRAGSGLQLKPSTENRAAGGGWPRV